MNRAVSVYNIVIGPCSSHTFELLARHYKAPPSPETLKISFTAEPVYYGKGNT